MKIKKLYVLLLVIVFLPWGCATLQTASKSASMKNVATEIWKQARLQDLIYTDKYGITQDAYVDFRNMEDCIGAIVEKPRIDIYGPEGGLVQCGDLQLTWCLQPGVVEIPRQHTVTSLNESFFAYIIINGNIPTSEIEGLQDMCL